MKYIDADRLKAEIEKNTPNHLMLMVYRDHILALIDSLQQEQQEKKEVKFVFPKYLYARTTNNKTIDVSYAPQSLDAVEYIRSDSLQQEQKKVDLRKEIDACWQNWLSPSNQKEVEGVLPKTEFAMYARHFYVLGRQEQPEVFDTVAFQKGVAEGRRLEREDVKSIIQSRIDEILGDARPAPILRMELQELIKKIEV